MSLALATVCWGCSEDGRRWDGVVELKYSQLTLERHIKRRFRQHSVGVVLRGDMAADSVWSDVLGHTFIARTPGDDGEVGITSMRPRRLGVPLRRRPDGIERLSIGRYEIEDGLHIVDVFSPQGMYVTSVLAATDMSARRMLHHLGATRPLSDSVDRLHLSADEVVYWREMMPIIVRNRGFGYLYMRAAERGREDSKSSDSLDVFAQHYELEEEGDFVLIGRDRERESYRHIFDAGGEYLTTAVHYGRPRREGREFLRHAGLIEDEPADVDTDTTALLDSLRDCR